MDTRQSTFIERVKVWACAEGVAFLILVGAQSIVGVEFSVVSVFYVFLMALFYTWPLILQPAGSFVRWAPIISPLIVLTMGLSADVMPWNVVLTLLFAGILLSIFREKARKEDFVFGVWAGFLALTVFVPHLLLLL